MITSLSCSYLQTEKHQLIKVKVQAYREGRRMHDFFKCPPRIRLFFRQSYESMSLHLSRAFAGIITNPKHKHKYIYTGCFTNWFLLPPPPFLIAKSDHPRQKRVSNDKVLYLFWWENLLFRRGARTYHQM